MLLAKNKDYSSYPKPVLGDFDLSRMNDSALQDQLTNARGPRFVGTPSWHPPVSKPVCAAYCRVSDKEQERSSEALLGSGDNTSINPNYVPHHWPVTEKTDIWGLGLIAHQMMFAHEPGLQTVL